MIRQNARARLQLPSGADVVERVEFLLRFLGPRFRRPATEPWENEPPLVRPYPWEAAYPPAVAWDLEVPRRPLQALLDDAVSRYGDRPFIECLGRRYSYAEIGRLAERAARGFQALGVGRGDRVGLLLPNTPYFVVAYFGVLKAGGTVVGLNPLYAPSQIAHILEDAGVRVVVTIDEGVICEKLRAAIGGASLEHVVVARMAGLLGFAQRSLHALFSRGQCTAASKDRHLAFDRLLANDGQAAPVPIEPERDVAILHYTGGIDGEPKAAMLTHTNLYANVLQAQRWFSGFTGESRILGAVPLCQMFGVSCVLNVGVAIGATLILLPRFGVDPVLQAIEKQRVTVLPGVPAMFAMLSGSPRCVRYDLSSLRLAVAGGAPLPAAVQERFETLTGARLVEGYGLTEAAPMVTCNPVLAGRRGDSVGVPVPGTVVEIWSLEAPRRRLPVGMEGEVCVRGPQVMAGYWKRPAATAAVLCDGLLHTGDIGYLDEDGYLHLTGRSKRLVLVGGCNVYPSQVEAAICAHPAVAAAEVAGVVDNRMGERLRAIVRLEPEASLSTELLRAHLKQILAPFEIPRDISIVPAAAAAAVGHMEEQQEEEEQRV